jgi:hypothetical protein
MVYLKERQSQRLNTSGDAAMPETDLGIPETDARFPNGRWAGFYLQYWFPGRHTTSLELMAAGGQLDGTGQDRVGLYTTNGSYDSATGRCEWTKQYVGKHRVRYRGINDGHGIWGVWEIRLLGGLYLDRVGFHIWAEGSDVSEESARTEQAVLEIMRREFGKGMGPARNLLILAVAAGIAAAATTWLLLGRWPY